MKKLLLSAVLILTCSSAYGAYNPIRNPEAVDCGEDNVFCASSCNRTDVLSACQGAEAYIADNGVGDQGAIVKIPSCPDGPTQPWPDSIEVSGGLRIIGSGRKGSANETQLEISAGGRFFGFNHEAATRNAQIEVAHIYFKGYHPTNGYQPGAIILIEDLHNAIVHDSDFEDGKNTHIYFRASHGDEPYPSGVIWNCTIKRVHASASKSQYGVRVAHGPDHNAASPFPLASMYLGLRNDQDSVVTVENCTFDDIYHPMSGFNGAHYVLRHSTLSRTRAGVDMHGPSYASDGRGRGTRAAEIYNNTFVNSTGTAHIKPRSGGGIIYNNVFKDSRYYLWFQGENGHRGRGRGNAVAGGSDCYEEGSPCDPGDSGCYQFNNASLIDDKNSVLSLACKDTTRESYQLTAPMTNIGFDIPKYWYIWGNDIHDSVQNGVSIRISDRGIENYVSENETYWLRAPTAEDDGFQWEPSKYPHHLRMEENDPPGIGAPMNLIVVE